MSGVDMVTDDIEQAWKAFQVAIAERMHAHGEDNHILWEMDVPERNECPCGPYVQVSWSDDDERLVAEVSGNRVLADKFRLTKDLRRHLPPETPRVTTAERAEQLRTRRIGGQLRRRW